MEYKIVCTDQYPPDNDHKFARIIKVGVFSDIDKNKKIFFTKEEVIEMLKNKDKFYTINVKTNQKTYVESIYDSDDDTTYIRTIKNDSEKDNLDSLTKCNSLWADDIPRPKLWL